eukprot:RCo021431
MGFRLAVISVVTLLTVILALHTLGKPCGRRRLTAPAGPPLATRDAFVQQHCYTQGRWVPGRPRSGGVDGRYHYRCNRTAAFNDSLRWQWQVNSPESCGLMQWDSRAVCEMLRGRNMLFYGDSLLQDIASTFYANLRGAGEGKMVHLPEKVLWNMSRNFVQLWDVAPMEICGGGAFSRKQEMFVVRGNTLLEDTLSYLRDIVRYDKGPPAVVVVAVGTHYVGVTMSNRSKISVVLEDFMFFRAMFRNHPIIWITQSAGHPRCEKFPPRPLESSSGVMEDYVRNNTMYGWDRLIVLRDLVMKDRGWRLQQPLSGDALFVAGCRKNLGAVQLGLAELPCGHPWLMGPGR